MSKGFTAYEGNVLVTLRCECDLRNTPLLLRGADLAVVCDKCGCQYVVMNVSFDKQSRQVIAEIGQIPPTKAMRLIQ